MELREEDDATGIIFITRCEEYMGMGYDVQAIQFLVKPLNWEKLKKALLNDWRKKRQAGSAAYQKRPAEPAAAPERDPLRGSGREPRASGLS